MTSEAVVLAKAGTHVDEAADCRIARLFDAHHVRLYRLARRMSATADDARDLVQETFLRAARSPAAVPSGPASEEAWLVRVLINVCRDGWRKRSTRARLHPLVAVGPLPAADPERALVARRTVWDALRRLSPRRRAAIVMYELDGLPIGDIARTLGVTAVTIRWHLSRGRKELARIIRSGA
jgi:RNA polymerase sigma-70 factor (ECF subfamily)